MSRIVKFIKVIRNNWKKSVFAAAVIAYGSNYAKTKYEIFEMMRVYCEESKKFGQMPIPVGNKPRHLTVILNPAARSGKSSSFFEKYASPLLHLAGVKVSVIKTEHEGQTKALMDIMDNTDAVLIAGGDGTLLEAITGLCRREDSESATNRFPIGIIPVGKTNTFAKYLFWDDHYIDAKLLAETTMAVIRGNTKPVNVMAVVGDNGKPVYALSSFEWGAYRDVKTRISEYWYWGFLKAKMAYFFASLKSRRIPIEGEFSISPPCEGCSKCYSKNRDLEQQSNTHQSSRWWHAFIPRSLPHSEGGVHADYSQIINEDCGTWRSENLNAVDMLIETCNNVPYCKEVGPPSLAIKIGPERIGRPRFLLEGWKRCDEEPRSDDGWQKIITAKEIKLYPKLSEDFENWFSIDNENHEARSVHFKLLPNRIRVFCKA